MLRFSHTQTLPIGLDLGHDSIKMIQLEVAGQSLAVRAAARRFLPEQLRAQPSLPSVLRREFLGTMLREGQFAGRRVVVSLPRQILCMRSIRLPLMPASELEAAVRFEADSILPFRAEEAQIRCLPAGEVRQGQDTLQEVIVLAARNADIDEFVEQVHRCGFIVDSVDAEPLALFRSVERFIRRKEDEQEVQVLVDVGLRQTQVVIGRGREISFIKSIDIGGWHFQQAIRTRLGIPVTEAEALRRRLIESRESPENPTQQDPVRQAVIDATRADMEQLAQEISVCLRYQSVTFRGHRPQRVRLLGGQACDPHLQAVLSAHLTIPLEPGRPLLSMDCSRMRACDRRGLMSEWALAIGLALKRTDQHFGPRDGRPRHLAGTPSTPAPEEAPAEPMTPSADQEAEPASAAVRWREEQHARA